MAGEERKEHQLELTEKTIKRTGDALSSMLEEISRKPLKRPAEELIRLHIETIDDLTRRGATLAQIFERMCKAVPLGISINTFGVYVRRVRQEVGSDLAVQRKAKPRIENVIFSMDERTENVTSSTDKQSENVILSTSAEPNDAPEVVAETYPETQPEVQTANWNCSECVTKAIRHESTKNPGKYFWRCPDCKTNYRDNNGELTCDKM